MISLGVLVWYAVGFWSHIYWVRNKYDYTTEYLGASLMAGITGPLSFWIGWSVYGNTSEAKILLRKRSDGE